MKIIMIAVGTKMPAWVTAGFTEYQKRMPPELRLELHEIQPDKRRQGDIAKITEREGQEIIEAIPKKAYVIALDEHGKEFDSVALAKKLGAWKNYGQDIALLIGGPDGLSQACKDRAQELWSLSKLTLPHPLVRVVLAETLYRAYSIDAGLPYHRA